MEDNHKITVNETNNSFLNGEQLTEINENIVHHQYFSNEPDNVNRSQCTVLLESCTEVHFGPKIENHYHQQGTTSDSNIIRENFDSIIVTCKERLKDRYRTNFQYMRSFFWDGKRNDFPIKDHFVKLIVEKSNLFGKKQGEKIDLEEIFSKEVEGHQTILLSGGSGYGKTTLCKKIAYDWASGGTSSNYLEHFDLVVAISLQGLGEENLYDLVIDNIFQNAEREVKSQIKREKLNILIMLDGFDEISNTRKSLVLQFIRYESFDISRRMTILVTSRPEATEHIREDMKSRFSVEGFSEQQQQKYIELMYKDHKDKGKELYEILKEKEYFSDIRKCPLILHMICCLYLNDNQCLKEGITDLYIRMVSLLIKRYISKTGGNYNFKEGKFFLGEDLLIRLSKSKDLLKNKITDLKELFPIEEEYEFIVGLGILELYAFSAFDEDGHYQFLHLSFREFIEALAAYFCPEDYIPDNVLLFVIGLAGKEPFPENVKIYLEKSYTELGPLSLHNPKFMLQAYREKILITNWELLCSFCRLIFSYSDLDDVKALLPLYNFTRVYFIFPESESTYAIFRDDLIDFYKNYNIFEELMIFLFADSCNIHMEDYVGLCRINFFFFFGEKKRYFNLNLLDVIYSIIDFFDEIGPIKNKIYFSGLAEHKHTLHSFREIDHSLEIPIKRKQMEKYSDENEEFVPLLIFNDSRHKIFYYVIPAKQYEILCDRIKVFPLSENEIYSL